MVTRRQLVLVMMVAAALFLLSSHRMFLETTMAKPRIIRAHTSFARQQHQHGARHQHVPIITDPFEPLLEMTEDDPEDDEPEDDLQERGEEPELKLEAIANAAAAAAAAAATAACWG